MRKLFLVAAAFTLCSGALADISHYVDGPYQPQELLDAGYTTTYVVDVRAVVGADDDWTSSSMVASIDGGNFLYSALNGIHTPVLDAIHAIDVTAGWDTLVSSTKANAGNFPDYDVPSFAGGGSFVWGAQLVDLSGGAWFATPPAGGAGDHLIARLTVQTDTPVMLTGEGGSTTVLDGGVITPFGFELMVPEPTTLSLLGLGFLALIRRR